MRLLLVLSLTLMHLVGAQSASGPTSLSGTVMDPQGRPIAAAVIALTRNGSSAVQLTTDVTGRFTFVGVSPGQYRVAASVDGQAAQH